MAGIMVSASTGVMNSLLSKLATLMGEEFAKLKNLRKEVKHISDHGVEVGTRSGVVSTASTTSSIGGMVQLDLDDGCVWMDERRAVVLFGVAAASTAGLARSMHQFLL